MFELARASAHGIVQGAAAELGGGEFRDGFLGGSVGSFGGHLLEGSVGSAMLGDINMNEVIAAAVVGGTAAEIGGGKFANGAYSAAFSSLVNQQAQANRQSKAEGAQRDELLTREEFESRYGDIIEAGNIDLADNLARAKKMTLSEWKQAVQTGGEWDYKNNRTLRAAGFDSKLLDEFGNVHFGMVARAQGFNLEGSMYGAGAYQVLVQGGGNPVEFAYATNYLTVTAGGYLLPDSITRSMTINGFGWGDNPGDALNIMKGWDYARNNY